MKKLKHLSFLLFSAFLLVPVNQTAFAAPKSVSMQESFNQKTITVAKSARVKIVLHSTYWSMESSGTLEAQGEPEVKPIMPSPNALGNCKFAGMGCGTVTWRFIASKAGTTEFVATRASCGEALKCTDAQRTFRVKIKVK